MLRVISGEFRGRRLVTPEGWSTRPTKGRIRESLFDLLGSTPEDARVLDLFAGSGALGIEALSRGARHAVFVESARAALRALRENVVTLGLGPRVTVVPGDALEPSPSTRGPFDLILADPPYDAAVEQRLVEEAAKRLAPRGVLALEHAADRPAPEAPSGLAIWKARRYGGTSLTLYVRVAEETS